MTENATKIPAYIYRDKINDCSLLQADILKVEGKFREYFTDFYPRYPDYTFYDLMWEFAQSPTVIDSLEDFQNEKPWIH